MPGSLDDTRPSVVSSAMSNPPSLIHRIGPKVEEKDDTVVNVNGVAQMSYDHVETRRRASAPLQAIPTMLDDEEIRPEQSVSQAYHPVRDASFGGRYGVPGPSTHREQQHFVINSEQSMEDVLQRAGSYRDLYALGKGFPNTVSTSRRAVSDMSMQAQRFNFYEDDGANSEVSGVSSSHSVSIKELLISAEAQPLASIVSVETRFLHTLQRKVLKKGMFIEVVPDVGANAIGAPRSMSEPPFVWVVLGHDRDVVRWVAQCKSQKTREDMERHQAVTNAAPPPSFVQEVVPSKENRGVLSKVGGVCASSLQLVLATLIGGYLMYHALLADF
ncbi:hypothetical protein SCHPADRAFT_908547 [Schizopora paradoxa]|uniref:Uncharacterized protein n=1 Tax=Schizopora paradoxa TaxID=27342 RepID=A0A0H2R9J3_9AGAM|nr:hypothetical protein SCHPADRAFT_908547 [Schizopora paradoxa]